ncbi:glycosyltransferase [Arthrobacter sp. SA17]
MLLFLQLTRRLPAALVQPLARTAKSVAPATSAAVPFLLADLVTGDLAELSRRFQLALDKGVSGNRARLLAEIALAGNNPQWADKYIQRAHGAERLETTLARRYWYDGAVSPAVDILSGSARARGQQQRLVAERNLLSGWSPSLPQQHVKPIPNRVLHLLVNSLPHTASGYAQRSHSILMAQRQTGWDPLAVTRLGYPVQVGKPMARSCDVVDGISYRRLLPARLLAGADARLQQQAEEMLKLATAFRPSILHTTTPYTNGLVTRAVAEAMGLPWVYEVRGQLADTWAASRSPEAKSSERYGLFQLREAEVMRSADLVLTLGESMKANILRAGVPEKKVLIAPNAVGGEFLMEPLDPAEARRRLGLPEEGQYIGTVSSLVPYEGIDDLIAAFAILAAKNSELRLLIVGDGISRPSLQEQARRSGHGDRILFTGRVQRSRTPLYHQALNVFVVPRKDLAVTRSVTPLKPVEAMASARPVVSSRLPALEEIVVEDGTGMLAAAGDPYGLARTLETLLGSPELSTRFGQAGRQEVLHNRTWEGNAQKLALAYANLTEARL